jgi:hypothetical protein
MEITTPTTKGKLGNEYGLVIQFDKRFSPGKKLYERAYLTLVLCQHRIRFKMHMKGDDPLFPITINLNTCKCSHVINDKKGLKTKKCKHGNYFVKIKEIETKKLLGT